MGDAAESAQGRGEDGEGGGDVDTHVRSALGRWPYTARHRIGHQHF